jgi:sarcosine oxidase subunit beta
VTNVTDQTADAVVVGGGTVGAWCAYFLRQAGLARVVLLEKGLLGQGASSRAAGVVRMQGGTPEAVRLGQWSRRFYLSQRDEIGTDSGFTEQGYLLPCFTEAEVAAAHARLEMQTALGVPVRWLGPGEVDAANPTLAPGQTLGGTFCAQDGFIRPPRNVAAYTAALLRSGVEVRERVAFLGLADGDRTVQTSQGRIDAGLVVLTGGPKLAEVGQRAGLRIPAGGARHQVAVTERHPDLDPARVPMVFDLAAGLYWRPEEGGLLFGMSNPDEPPGDNREVDEGYLAKMRARLAALVPVTAGLGLRRIWAATIDYTPDHLPIIGRARDRVTVACAGGAGMMWGPGVARAAADVALTGSSDVLDVSPLGLDRFDEAGRSRLATDPIALPFPDRIASS